MPARKVKTSALHINLENYFQTDEIFKNAFQYSAIGMALVSLEGKWLKVNSRVCEIVGYSESELLKLTFQDITHADDLDLDLSYVKQMIEGKIETYKMEKRYLHKNGSVVWVLLSVSLVKDKEKNPLFFISQIEDITERKLTNEQLMISEKRYRAFFDDSPISLWEEDFSAVKLKLDELKRKGITDFESYIKSHPEFVDECSALVKIIDVNDISVKLFNAKDKTDLTISLNKLLANSQSHKFEYELINIAKGITRFEWEEINKKVTGEVIHIRLTWYAIPGHEEDLSKVIISIIDITESKQIQQELQKSEERYKSIVENMPLVLYLDTADEKSSSYYISPQVETLLGYTPSAYIENPNLWHKQIAPQDYQNAVHTIQETLVKGKSIKEYRLIARDGRTVWVRDSSVLIRDQDGKPKFIQGFIEDISEQLRTKEELQKSEARYKSIVEDMPMMMCRFKPDGTLTFINTFYCHYFKKNYEQLLGSNLFDLIPEEERKVVREKYLSLTHEKPFVTYEYKTVDSSGKVNWQKWTDRALFNEKGEIHEYQSVGEDITERKQAENLKQNENQIMEMIASGAELYETLTAITKNVETFFHDAFCSILLLDKDGIHLRHGAAPNLPKEYIDAIDGLAIGDIGSCGTAAYRKKIIISADIATDPLWADYKDIALKHGLRACWSTPIMNDQSKVYGTFAIYYAEPRAPKQEEFDLINRATHQAKIVIEQKLANEVREESEKRYRALFEDSPISLWEDDYSEVKKKIEELRNNGITDFKAYFAQRPEKVKEFASLVKILDANQYSVKLFNAKNKADLLEYSRKSIATGLIDSHEFINIANGITHFEWEGVNRKLSGELMNIKLTWSVALGYEDDLSKVIISIIDTTEQKQAEEERRVLIQELGERVQELTFLHNISRIFMDDTRPEDDVMQSVVDMMPSAWQYPEIAAARIGFNGSQFTTPNFKQTDWMLSHFFEYPGGNLGVVQVSYLKEMPQAEEGPFLREEQYLLESTAEKVQTYLKGLSADRSINRQLTELETLYESGLAISKLLTPKDIAHEMIDVLERRMNWHHIAIREYQPESNSVKLIGFSQPGISAKEAEELIKKMNSLISNPTQGLSGWVTIHGKSIRVPNVKIDDRYLMTYSEISSGIYVPLKVGERVIGSISVESEIENTFSEHDERLLETLAGQAAIAIENANLFGELQSELIQRRLIEDEVRQLNAELEKRVKERTLQIEATKRRLELATHAGHIGVWEYSPRENKVIWDDRMHMIHLVSPAQFEGTAEAWAKHIHPQDLEKSQMNIQLAFTQNLLLNNEHRIIWNDGTIRTIATSAVTVFAEDNTPDRIIGISIDITERKQIQQSLQESEAYARLLFDAAPEPVFVAEVDGTMVDVNKFFEIQHHIKNEEVRGKHIAELGIFPPEELEKTNDYIVKIVNGENIPPLELKFYSLNDGLHTLELHSYPIEVDGRQLVLSTSRDITTHKKFEEALKLANAEMENALQVKDEFLANMSHELRTPLNAILGISESLEEQFVGNLNEKQAKYVGIIKESGRHLLELINDILDISKIEAGRMELNFSSIGVEKLCQASLRMIKELAQKKNLQISFKIIGDVKTIMGDERRLKQVLVNLLSNAVKFTEEGKKIGLEVIGYPEKNEVSFSVWDSGIGIAQEELKYLFKPFVQLDAGLAREFQGTGLGLALVAQMIRLHGGLVGVRSDPGKGSKFTITLPWEPEEQKTPVKVTAELVQPSQKSEEKRKGKVLLVEDTDIIVALVKDYLTFKGYQVLVAHNGREGILLAKEQRPDIILMDVMMPIMDGIEATKEIRTEYSLKKTPIIALTALAMPGDRERCLEAGMTDYMSKPVKLNELIELIEKYTAQG